MPPTTDLTLRQTAALAGPELLVMQLERAAAEAAATPCPVAWCDLAGRHLYDDEGGSGAVGDAHVRGCSHELAGAPEGVSVAAFYDEHADGTVSTGIWVDADISQPGELESPAAVSALVDALRRAAALAFPGEVVDGGQR